VSSFSDTSSLWVARMARLVLHSIIRTQHIAAHWGRAFVNENKRSLKLALYAVKFKHNGTVSHLTPKRIVPVYLVNLFAFDGKL